MNAVDAQIKSSYEVGGLTPAQIAIDLGFEEVAVKAKLMQISTAYRKACGAEPEDESELNFSDTQLKEINDRIYKNAIYATLPDGSFDYKTSERAAEYIRDDKKGRRDVKKTLGNGNTFNVIQFNEQIQQARLQAQEARKQLADKQPIEV